MLLPNTEQIQGVGADSTSGEEMLGRWLEHRDGADLVHFLNDLLGFPHPSPTVSVDLTSTQGTLSPATLILLSLSPKAERFWPIVSDPAVPWLECSPSVVVTDRSPHSRPR